MAQKTEIDFETHVEKVKDIIKQLNDNTLNLKDGMKLYKDAQAHINTANKMLEEAEFELKNALEQQ
ncbi:exodeoxyribonuclease VII small subunit [Helicobacter trogontum]|uniref:Exodeoxyribonuclease VII small subunit n=1 Tax=Helicobacter trogontum TaxID=50960 RepID=A0A099VE62_9HELI|nr:exodeoxyribonuclease VII small subunit [Helicobacter trogontum]MCI5787239.1 exodeoxyribonuclease VII small subunit [Helicobacter trogontum]MDY5185492.1 exodeoxyribonuclease VII small subunit [Helicobacter trogontum]TLD83730.1 exodeoxyribonuclease VII small subunit [Helicobacter trogontum]TLD99315.1 exodeoxyribonuclease VII small subunit [Helicobacter trogontum]